MAAGLSTSGAVGVVVKGVPEARRALERLGTRGSRTASRKALTAGMKPVTKAVRSELKLQVGKVTGLLYKSPGARQGKNKKKGIFEAKVGLNVGKTKAKGNYAPHAAIIALGTKIRTTKDGGNRGAGPRHNIVPSAYAKSASKSLSSMKAKLLDEIENETKKARAR